MPLLALCYAFDLPLSIIGDTVTLPYILYVQAQKQRAADKPQGNAQQALPDR